MIGPRLVLRQTAIGSPKRARQVHLAKFAARHLPLHRSSDNLASNVQNGSGVCSHAATKRVVGCWVTHGEHMLRGTSEKEAW